MEHSIDIAVMMETLYTIDEIIDIERIEEEPDEEVEDEEEEAKPSSKTYEEKMPTYLEKYNKKFNLSLTGVYMDEDEGRMKIEYDVFYEGISPVEHERIIPEINIKDPQYQTEFNLLLTTDPEKYTKSISVDEGRRNPASYRQEVLSIEYEKPELINGQKTYQRIVLKADREGESVYDLTMRKLGDAGIEVSAEYDDNFDSMLFTSINGRSEGADGNFNEFYVDGEIGKNAADGEMLKKDKIVEIRYAEETDGSCGGVPDYDQIKSLLEHGPGMKTAFHFMPHGSIFAY